ncbi:hypothetical protein RRG08_062324 [Elysia crispata]|uniref:Uncharacterized protein n=1 Tax=Elysia crispata TaxID=231223 RepID=A0AAE0YH87_9GAST|nr:hypothetical protein RRG08_062324 [Elysia crispata]
MLPISPVDFLGQRHSVQVVWSREDSIDTPWSVSRGFFPESALTETNYTVRGLKPTLVWSSGPVRTAFTASTQGRCGGPAVVKDALYVTGSKPECFNCLRHLIASVFQYTPATKSATGKTFVLSKLCTNRRASYEADIKKSLGVECPCAVTSCLVSLHHINPDLYQAVASSCLERNVSPPEECQIWANGRQIKGCQV